MPQVTPLPQSFSATGKLIVAPEKILETRNNQSGCLEVLVQWLGLPSHESSWCLGWSIAQQYPEFQLEDKLRFVGRGIDTMQQLYFRKRSKKSGGSAESRVGENVQLSSDP